MPHRHDQRRTAEQTHQRDAHGASFHPPGDGPDAGGLLQPDDYYDGRQRGGVSEGSFARGGYGQGYPREYGGYGYEPRRSPQVRGEFAYPDVQAGPPSGPGGGHADADYRQWRAEHLRALDDDYRSYREEQRRNFPAGFSAWREGRRGDSADEAAAGERREGGSGGTQSSSAGQTASGDPSGTAAALGAVGGGTASGIDGE